MENLNKIPVKGLFKDIANFLNANFTLIKEALEEMLNKQGNDKGIYSSAEALQAAYPSPQVGNRALVGAASPFTVYQCETDGLWKNTGITESHDITLADYATKQDVTEAVAGITVETVNSLEETTPGKALDATQGKALADRIATLGVSVKNQADGKTYKLWVGTQAEYDAITDKDDGTIYLLGEVVSGHSGSGDTPTPTQEFGITYNLSHVIKEVGAAVKIMQGGTASARLTAEEGYILSAAGISVTGATFSFSGGILTLSNPTGPVTVTASATVVEQPPQPGNYTPANYISTGAAAWIDTGVVPTLNTKCIIKFKVNNQGGNVVMGNCNPTDANSWRFIYFNGAKFDWNGAPGRISSFVNHYQSVTVCEFGNRYMKLTDVAKGVEDAPVTGSTMSTLNAATQGLTIGIASSEDWKDHDIMDMDIYYAQIYDGDSLVRDFVAATVGGVAGMWDKVEGKFYPSKTETAFTAH